MKILVTGGTGFTGKALVKRLLDDGHDVIALDHKEGIKTNELVEWGAKVKIGSVTDRYIVSEVMQGVDVVHHLAAAFRELNVPNSYYDAVNVQGTRNVLEAAYRYQVRKFVYCSTCGVHGNVEHPPAAENAPIAPTDYYQRTKYDAEPVVLEFAEKGLATVTLRPAAIYGPGDPERFGMICRRVKKGTFPIFGDGKTLYHPLYIDNFVDVFITVQQPGVGDGQTYLIADTEWVEIEDLVHRVAKAMDTTVKTPHFPFWPLHVTGQLLETICKPLHLTPPIFPRRVDWFRQNRAFDTSKAKRELGFNPSIGLDEGLKRTADWCLIEGYL